MPLCGHVMPLAPCDSTHHQSSSSCSLLLYVLLCSSPGFRCACSASVPTAYMEASRSTKKLWGFQVAESGRIDAVVI